MSDTQIQADEATVLIKESIAVESTTKVNVDSPENYEQHCLLFPTYASKHSPNDSVLTNDWNIRVRGWAYSAPKSSRSRTLFLGFASYVSGLQKTDASYETFESRTSLFWASNLDREEFSVKVIGLTNSNKMVIEGDPNDPSVEQHTGNVKEDTKKLIDNVQQKHAINHPKNETPSISITPKTGHFSGSLAINQTIVDKWLSETNTIVGGLISNLFGTGQHKDRIKLLKIEAIQNNSAQSTYGIVNLIEPEGFSVVSDIDDTIKQTAILDGARTVLSNTFIKPFKDVPGMADIYNDWYDKGVAIHYVSNSPWQLFPMLRSFFNTYKFPPGSAHLKFYDGLFKSAREQKEHPMASKFMYIRELIKDFPKRKFILIGDTGELDPEIYTTIAREYPDRILRIFVRDVTTEHVKDLPAQPPHYSYAQTFTTTYDYLKSHYTGSDGKNKNNNEGKLQETEQGTEGIPDATRDIAKEHKDPKPRPQHQPSLSDRMVDMLHTEISSLHSMLSSCSDHVVNTPDGVITSRDTENDAEKANKKASLELKTPLQMFHEKLENLSKGLPTGLFSTFTDPSELKNDPIIRKALNY